MKIPSCKMLIVTNAKYADCNGRYEFSPALRAPWAPDRPVFERLHTKGRGHVWCKYIFWTEGKGHGKKWAIGDTTGLTRSGGFYHGSKGHNKLV